MTGYGKTTTAKNLLAEAYRTLGVGRPPATSRSCRSLDRPTLRVLVHGHRADWRRSGRSRECPGRTGPYVRRRSAQGTPRLRALPGPLPGPPGNGLAATGHGIPDRCLRHTRHNGSSPAARADQDRGRRFSEPGRVPRTSAGIPLLHGRQLNCGSTIHYAAGGADGHDAARGRTLDRPARGSGRHGHLAGDYVGWPP